MCHHFGRRPKLSHSDGRKLVRMFRNYPATTKAQTCHNWKPEHQRHCPQGVLYDHGLKGWRPRKKPLLYKQHLQARLKFVAAHMDKIKYLLKWLRSSNNDGFPDLLSCIAHFCYFCCNTCWRAVTALVVSLISFHFTRLFSAPLHVRYVWAGALLFISLSVSYFTNRKKTARSYFSMFGFVHWHNMH